MSEGFWEFSLRFYDDAGTQADCLHLQDAHGADVNVVLCVLWHAAQGTVLTPEGVAELDATVAPWRGEVVQPLRALRRRLKEAALSSDAAAQESFRNKVKAVELSAEKLQQAMLEAATPDSSGTAPPAEAAETNLMVYADTLSPRPPEALLARFRARLEAVTGG